jgi:hypothetical protein
MIAMAHVGFIVASYAITFSAVIGYSVFVIRRGRALAQHAKKEDMPWT